jgi:hypothetical protein
MKKKTAGAKTAKSPKRRRFVAGLIDGKSMRRAALDAGYSKSMANNAGLKILPGIREEFKRELSRKVPKGKLIQRIAEGLDARAVKLAQFEGDFTDKRYLVDYCERRRYVELAAKIMGYLVQNVEVPGADQAPVDFNLQVNFLDPDDPHEELMEKLLPECLDDAESQEEKAEG